MKNFTTIGRVNNLDDARRALELLAADVNRLGNSTQDDVAAQVDALTQQIAAVQTSIDATQAQLDAMKNSTGGTLSAGQHLRGGPFTGVNNVTISTDATPDPTADTLMVRDSQAGVEVVESRVRVITVLRPEPAAAILPFLEIRRNGVTLFYMGLDADDNLTFLGADAATSLTWIDADGKLQAVHVLADTHNDKTGLQLLTDQQPAIADPTVISGSVGSWTNSATPSDPATLGDLDGVGQIASNAYAAASDALNTAVGVAATVSEMLGMLRTHGVIAT